MDLSREPRPLRERRPRPVSAEEWSEAGEVPGGLLPERLPGEQYETLRAIDGAQRRARVRAGSYFVG
jgi:hypothetical protein